jgi:hypothetical protein
MNKNDILAKSRNENKNGDERESDIRLRSYAISASIGAIICMLLIIIESFFDRSTSMIWIIYSGMMVSKDVINAIKLKKKMDIGLSIIWGIVLVLHIILYILDNIG